MDEKEVLKYVCLTVSVMEIQSGNSDAHFHKEETARIILKKFHL